LSCWTRTNIIITPHDGNDNIIVKVWDTKCEIFHAVHTGQLVTCYVVNITTFNGMIDLTVTDETTIDVTEIRYAVLQLIIIVAVYIVIVLDKDGYHHCISG